MKYKDNVKKRLNTRTVVYSLFLANGNTAVFLDRGT